MNQQERDVINGIFDRLKQAEHQPRDAEAEVLIAERLTAQPGAAYLLAQIVHVQEQALAIMNERIQTLETEVAQAKSSPLNGGFLAGLFGAPTAQTRKAQPAAHSPQNAGAWNQSRQPSPPEQPVGPWGVRNGMCSGAAGGGFLATAMTTAVGVAGGMMLGNALTSAFGLGSHAGATDAAGGFGAKPSTHDASGDAEAFGGADSSYHEADYNADVDGGFEDFSGGDDWI